MKKKLLITISSLLILLILIGIGAYRLYCRYYITIAYCPEIYSEMNHPLNNPYQGWYHIYGYTLSDSAPIRMDPIQASIEKDLNELALIEINLHNYASSDISRSGLSQIEAILLAWKNAGKQLILRFLYDWNGSATETEPKDIAVIKRHMEQCAEIINQHTDSIYLIQGIFVGNCGEMNGSDHLSEDAMKELASCLASLIDPSVYLSVRTPAQWRAINQTFEPLSAEEAFSGTLAARTGLFNDGMLGSVSDLGTYGETSLTLAKQFTDSGTREEEIAFQNKLCTYVPNGGEVVCDNEYNDFPNALESLKDMHVSYLDCSYDYVVLDKWRASVYTGDDCFNGTNGYFYIGAHLGYRYAILASDCTFETFCDSAASMTLTIENSGFSNCYRSFSSTVTVVREDGSICDTLTIDSDSRFWNSGETVTLSVPLDIRTYQTGTYTIYYKLTDDTLDRIILLSNTLDFDEELGYRVASLTVGK